MADERILDRVRKLLARAEHPTTPPAEAEACSAKAAALMSRYVIDQAMLDATRPVNAKPVVRTVSVVPPYSTAKSVLLDEVARAFGVIVAIGRRETADGRRCTLVGFEPDIAMTEMLFTSLLLQASAAMLAASRGRPDVKAFRRAFLIGYAGSIGRRLAEAQRGVEQAVTSATPGAALVLADRADQVKKAFAAEFPRIGTMRATVSSGGGLAAGSVAGQRADLSAMRSRLGGGRRELSA